MPRRCWLAAALLSAAGWSAGCTRPVADSGATTASQGASVLLVTLDTTRADRLGCYGYAAAQTPALDALARAGVRFTQAFCQVPLTLPSHTSLLTSTHPPTNGLRVNGAGVLGQDLPTLAEQFRTRGHRTAAFVGAWVLNRAFGLNRGFEHYDDRVGATEEDAALDRERPANAVCDAALRWLAGEPDKPFFAWVHFFDPHDPYAPPAEFRDKLADPYDGEIAFVDTQVARLFQWLEARKLRERTLVVVAGDHGEAFGEHGEVEHGLFVYDTTMHVPLLFAWPARLPRGTVVSAGVRLIDVAPTIVDLLGWDPAPDWEGRSLRPALTGETFSFLPAYGETEYPLVGLGWAPLRSYTAEAWKYIDAPRPELYDRRADPGELTNVIAEDLETAARLQRELADLLKGMKKRSAEAVALDEQSRRALESLGYIAPSTSSIEAERAAPRRDPKEVVHVFQGLGAARRLLQQGQHADVVRVLEPLVEQSPESDELYTVLAEAYLKLGRWADAERAFRASLRIVPDNPGKLTRLGDALLQQKKTDEALACWQQAAARDYAQAHSRLGALYLQRRQFEQAHEHLQRHVALEPDSPHALTNLANLLPQMRRQNEAVELLRKALRIDPSYAPAHRFLWQVLMATGRRGEAITALRAACRLVPSELSLKRTLAGLLSATPQAGPDVLDEAITIARACCAADPRSPENFDVLAIACAAAGDFPSAIAAAERAQVLATSQGRPELAERIAARLEAYRAGRPR